MKSITGIVQLLVLQNNLPKNNVMIINNIKETLSNIFIFLLVFFTQFSSINREVIDWDESTFFILSKYLANGEVLYIDYWDGKPPMIFLYLSLFFKIFGSNLLVGRLAGDFLIFISCILIFKILRSKFSNSISLSSSLFLIYLFSYDASQPTMTEHLGIVFILLSMYIVLNNEITLNYYLLGLLFSFAFNTRNNLAFTCFGLFLYLIYINKLTFYSFLQITTGFMLPVIVGFIYFYTVGGLKNYFYMLFEFPIQNTSNRYSFDDLKIDIFNKLNLDKILSIEILITIFVAVSIIYFFKSAPLDKENHLLLLNIVLFLSTFLSIYAGGRLYGHYLIQVFPFVTIFIAAIMNIISNIRYSQVIYFLIALTINIALLHSGLNNLINYNQISENYPSKALISVMDELLIDDSSLVVLDYHIIYLNTNRYKSPTIIHPSNQAYIERNKLFLNSLFKLGIVEMKEFEKNIQNKPKNVICYEYCNEVLPKKFFENYKIESEIKGVKIFSLIHSNK